MQETRQVGIGTVWKHVLAAGRCIEGTISDFFFFFFLVFCLHFEGRWRWCECSVHAVATSPSIPLCSASRCVASPLLWWRAEAALTQSSSCHANLAMHSCNPIPTSLR